MTAEVAVLNCEAIAIAADSAVTMTSPNGQKIFSSANKIFALSKYHPVGIMVYGNAAFTGMPWETIIKLYRNYLGKRKFKKLENYGTHFLQFVRSNKRICPAAQQRIHLENCVVGYFQMIRDQIERSVQKELDKKSPVPATAIPAIVSAIIVNHYTQWKAAKFAPKCGVRDDRIVGKKYGELFSTIKKAIFGSLPLTRQNNAQLLVLAWSVLLKNSPHIPHPTRSGVVVAGFGEEELFPQCSYYTVNVITNGRLNYSVDGHTSTSYTTSAVIAPFAQDDVARMFLQGVAPALQSALLDDFRRILREYPPFIVDNIPILTVQQKTAMKAVLAQISNDKFKSALEKLTKYKQEKHIFPVTRVVAMLPKDSLADMAESLVNLTSFKRKVSMGAETVGGPIDVAVISKGDGFIWIKRKHYFKPELNQHFFANYYRSLANGGRI